MNITCNKKVRECEITYLPVRVLGVAITNNRSIQWFGEISRYILLLAREILHHFTPRLYRVFFHRQGGSICQVVECVMLIYIEFISLM